MADKFNVYNEGLESPASNYFAITPSDSVNFNDVTRGIYSGDGGNIVCVDKNDNAVTFVSVPAGVVLPIRAKRINATSTTATNMVGLY